MISSVPSSRPSRKITTATIEQITDKIKIDNTLMSIKLLFQIKVGANLSKAGTKIKIKKRYNQNNPTENHIDLRFKELTNK
ncbi:MAG: hypothetical protein LBF00_00615 [Mycoplasmataceae bacterium]|jgi:hypothetical protein|nr:hypothetical protein [Mycoplasmataceae bacterium]